jgi:hypothetical protein
VHVASAKDLKGVRGHRGDSARFAGWV